MSGSVNKVILVGNVGRDPEIRDFQNGGQVANLSLATSERWTDKQSGENKERTEWHRVAVFAEPLIDVVSRFVKKGSKLYVEGQLETRKYTDQNGSEKFSTEIVLRPFRSALQLLGGTQAPAEGDDAPRRSGQAGTTPRAHDRSSPPRSSGGPAGSRGGAGPSTRRSPPPPPTDDDDIPF